MGQGGPHAAGVEGGLREEGHLQCPPQWGRSRDRRQSRNTRVHLWDLLR